MYFIFLKIVYTYTHTYIRMYVKGFIVKHWLIQSWKLRHPRIGIRQDMLADPRESVGKVPVQGQVHRQVKVAVPAGRQAKRESEFSLTQPFVLLGPPMDWMNYPPPAPHIHSDSSSHLETSSQTHPE